MLYNTHISMALKGCNGEYKIEDSNIFDIESLNGKFTSVSIKLDKNKGIIFMIKCPICGHRHIYSYNLSDIIKHDLVFGGCESLGLPIFFIGKNDNVKQMVRKYYEVNKNISAMI